MTNTQRHLPSLEDSIYSKVLEVIRLLRESNRRIVLAESCTGGMVSSWFVSIPGVSDVFCGSMVVYRNDTKSKWLGLDPSELADPQVSSVGPWASQQLARKVMLGTPEADVGISVTGHLRPESPSHVDRKIFLAGMVRSPEKYSETDCDLELTQPSGDGFKSDRRTLQLLATFETLSFTVKLLDLVDGFRKVP
ncbi:MAG: CinA family protein [Planctomycetes bacterium]|nr:CinA family protein [Planctomycetota bacterium]